MLTFLCFAGAIALVVWALKQPGPPELQHPHITITAPLQQGTLEVIVRYTMTPGDPFPFQASAERIIRRWSLSIDPVPQKKDTPKLWDILEADLQKQFGCYCPLIDGFTVSGTEPNVMVSEPEKPPITPMQQAEQDLETAAAQLTGYITKIKMIEKEHPELNGADHAIAGRSVLQNLKDITDQRIKRIVNPSGL